MSPEEKYVCTRDDTLYICAEWSTKTKEGKRSLQVYNGLYHQTVEDNGNSLKKFSKDVDDVRKMGFMSQGLM